jgi:hypothetical protein
LIERYGSKWIPELFKFLRAGGTAPVSPPTTIAGDAAKKDSRARPNRGKAGGRTRFQALRLNEIEETRLKQRAAEAGLSVSSYLRACALGDAGVRARRAPTFEHELLGSSVAELNRVGNNVNQIARSLNIGKETDPALIAFTLEQLRAVLADIRKAMRT